jgi:hypothetical protein
VSSFAALVKDKGFFLIFSPRWGEMAAAAGLCVTLGVAVLVAKRVGRAVYAGAAGDAAPGSAASS